MNISFKFKSLNLIFPDNSDSIKMNELNAIKIKTGDCFLQTYVENLCKKNNKEDREDIKKHAVALYEEMFKYGYCSSNGKQMILDTIKTFNEPSIDVLAFLNSHKEAFSNLPIKSDKNDPISYFGNVVQDSLKDITARFGKVLDK